MGRQVNTYMREKRAVRGIVINDKAERQFAAEVVHVPFRIVKVAGFALVCVAKDRVSVTATEAGLVQLPSI